MYCFFIQFFLLATMLVLFVPAGQNKCIHIITGHLQLLVKVNIPFSFNKSLPLLLDCFNYICLFFSSCSSNSNQKKKSDPTKNPTFKEQRKTSHKGMALNLKHRVF